jgi:two-component system, cell cycle response regulator DivK
MAQCYYAGSHQGRIMAEEKMILHVEDNADNRLLVRRLLHAEGYQVIEAENGRKALLLLANNKPDLILVDINMPEMDGYTLTHKMKCLPGLSNIPVIAITANVMKGDKEKSLQAGCDGYIEKPIDIDIFYDQIHLFLG